MTNPNVHHRLLPPHRLMVISWSRKTMSFCYGYILMKIHLRVVDWRRQAQSQKKTKRHHRLLPPHPIIVKIFQ